MSSGKAPQPNMSPSVIRADECYPLDEFARRLRWKKHSIRQAQRMGLRTILFGSRLYVLGSDGLKFFELLATRQMAESQSEDTP